MVDQRGGAQVLAAHVLIKVCVNQDAAFREELIEIGYSHIIGVDVANFEFALVESALGWLQLLHRLLQTQSLLLGLLLLVIVLQVGEIS